MPKHIRRVIIIFLLVLFGLTSALSLEVTFSEKVIGVIPFIQRIDKPASPNFLFLREQGGSEFIAQTKKIDIQSPTGNLVCSSILAPEDLSVRGKANYEIGRFDEARNCWQISVINYLRQKNESEAINNQINQAQAELMMGLYPRACDTLLPIYGEEDCSLLIQNQGKRKKFSERLERAEKRIKLLNNPTSVSGLRLLANIFRGLGELDWSYQILISLANAENSLPEQEGAIWLDLGNTIRTLSNRKQDFYNRTQQPDDFNCAFTYANLADRVYQEVLDFRNQPSDSQSLIQIQTQLNQLSLIQDLISWRDQSKKETQSQKDIFQQFQEKYDSSQKNIKCAESKNITKIQSSFFRRLQNKQNDDRIYKIVNQLARQNVVLLKLYVDNLQKKIDRFPQKNYATLFLRLNFAKILIRLRTVSDSEIEKNLNITITQARDINDSKMESYGYGYLGNLYENRQKWKLASDNTQKALFLAQSLSTAASPSEIEYLWEWQLGRIYKSQLPLRTQAQTKEIQQESLKNLNNARQWYEQAYLTLQSLRKELVVGNPDAQLSFQNDIEGIYRDYINLLLWNKNPEPENLAKAREVIASLQAVELENFLRLACPEFNIEEIDKIIDRQAVKAVRTAFLYPILLEDRIEVILRLPNDLHPKEKAKEEEKNSSLSNLEHYSTPIDEDTVKKQIKEMQIDLKEPTFNAVLRKLQLDLEEEYTFDDIKKEAKLVYDWLLKGAEQYLQDQKIDILVFALDTNLRNVPLAALVVEVDKKEGKPIYLIDRYAVALAPRLDIPNPNPQPLKGRKIKILAAGLKEQKDNKLKFPKLNYVEEELKAIEEIPNSNFSVSLLKDENFKLKEFTDKVNNFDFRVLHLATHGQFSSSPEKTFLLASDSSIQINQVSEIFRIQAQQQPEPIEMLVLSACETAAGDKRATLGISGVAVRAGARTAVASLWTLDDEISVDFTKLFYKQLINPKVTTKAQALQEAQKKLKLLSGREHPRYWSPYILLGNWLEF